ncbi:MAG: cation-translocating P-type ATPase [Myxococcales bacterium]|nr:MAG: cation-translocating P-type ATPase [Myxococcales bacterium]
MPSAARAPERDDLAMPTAGVCTLCGAPIPSGQAVEGSFCCAGCARVHEVLANLPPDAHAAYVAAARRLGLIATAQAAREQTVETDAAASPTHPEARRETRFRFGGLACPSCSWVAEQVLLACPGVEKATVDFFSGTGLVRYDMRRTAPDRLAETLKPLGYRLGELSETEGLRPSQGLTFSFVAAAILTMNLMSLSTLRYFERHGGLDAAPEEIKWLEFLLAAPVVWLAWLPIARRAWQGFRRGATTMDALIAIGSGAAFILSLAALSVGRDEIYFETFAGLVTISLLSRLIEARLRDKTFADLATLLRMPVSRVRKIEADGKIVYPGVDSVRPGDRIVFAAGDVVPFDGDAASGGATVSEAVLTGEPRPRQKAAGDAVIAGSSVVEGSLTLAVRRRFDETRLHHIAASLRQALAAGEERLRSADRVARWFTPLVLAIAFLAWAARVVVFGWAYAFSAEGWFPSIAVLAVACPCAFSLAGVSALTAATGALLKRGILVKDAVQLEELNRVGRVVFDKTGTLSEGRMSVERLVWRGPPQPALLPLVLAAEAGSGHPVAAALRQHLEAHAAVLPEGEIIDKPGEGRLLQMADRTFTVGSAGLFEEAFTPDGADERHTLVWFGENGRAAGCFVIADALRREAKEALGRLASDGLKLELISGDRQAACDWAARSLGVPQVRGGATLDDKVLRMAELKRAGETAAFVGDGTNDALAMSAATVSVALAKSTDEALAAAGFILLHGDLKALPDLFAAGRRLTHVIRWNYVWAFAFNTLFIPVAALGELLPVAAMALMLVSSTAVLLNANRLRRRLI